MAIVSGQTATGAISVTNTGTATFGGNTLTGDTIIVFVMTNTTGSNHVNSVTDSQGNNYQLITVPIGSNNGTIEVWYASNITGGTTPTITVSLNRNTSGGIIAREYSGLALTNSFDTGNLNSPGTGSTSATSNPTHIVSRELNEVVIGALIYASGTPTVTLGAGYTNLSLLTGGGSTRLAIEDNIVSTASLQTATFTASASGAYVCLVVTFADTTIAQPTLLNNYQFVKVGDGMSVSEKIR